MNVSSISSTPPTAPLQFNAAAVRNAAPAAQRAAVASQFEAVLVRQLLGPTVSSMLGGSQGSVAGSVYGDLLADTISQQLSAGRGLGLGRYIEQQLTPREGNNPSVKGAIDTPAAHASAADANPILP